MELGHGWDVIVNRSSEPFTVGFQTRGTAPGDGLTECEDLDSFGQTHMATVVEIVTSSLHPQETESDARTSTPLVCTDRDWFIGPETFKTLRILRIENVYGDVYQAEVTVG